MESVLKAVYQYLQKIGINDKAFINADVLVDSRSQTDVK
jgi:hypothetical protein